MVFVHRSDNFKEYMTLDQLRTFQAVATARSFRGAADVLHITQPAISKQIQALEAELDERLFERGRSAQLTSAGTALLKHVEHLSRVLTVAKEEITDLRELRAGHLSIGAAHSVATYVLPSLIEAYRARYPKVNLSIESGWSLEIIGRIMTYDLDLGLLVLLSPKLQAFQQLTLVPLATSDLVFVTSPNGPLAGRKKITWDDLREAPWILNHDGCVYRSYIERRLKEHGQTLKVEVQVMGLELQKKLTELGLGVSLLPRKFVTTELRQGSLKALNVEGTKLQVYSCLVLRKDKYIHGAMKGFLRLVQKTFQPPKNGLTRYLRPL
jgi:DNA-binding transcriptional LysR family regulator